MSDVVGGVQQRARLLLSVGGGAPDDGDDGYDADDGAGELLRAGRGCAPRPPPHPCDYRGRDSVLPPRHVHRLLHRGLGRHLPPAATTARHAAYRNTAQVLQLTYDS